MSSYRGLRSTTFRISPYVPFENANRHSRAPVDILGHKMAQGTKLEQLRRASIADIPDPASA